MVHAPQINIPAVYLRSGASKDVFFTLDDLPESARAPGSQSHDMAQASPNLPAFRLVEKAGIWLHPI